MLRPQTDAELRQGRSSHVVTGFCGAGTGLMVSGVLLAFMDDGQGIFVQGMLCSAGGSVRSKEGT
jgi:hypothetical protein